MSPTLTAVKPEFTVTGALATAGIVVAGTIALVTAFEKGHMPAVKKFLNTYAYPMLVGIALIDWGRTASLGHDAIGIIAGLLVASTARKVKPVEAEARSEERRISMA